MAHVHFDSSYAPCGFLIVQKDGHYRAESTVLVQSDWDFPCVAKRCGWGLVLKQAPGFQDRNNGIPCEHDGTDGTVDCPDCGCAASDFISAAYDFLREVEGEEFELLDEYLTQEA